jgi:serine/threonine-protein kinase
MKKCPVCGIQNLDSSYFCDECGTNINEVASEEEIVQNAQVESENQSNLSDSMPKVQAANITSVDFSAYSNLQNESNAESLIEHSKANESKELGVLAKLVIERGISVGTEFLITSTESQIGRWDADNGIFPDIDLDSHDPEAKISRKHARIYAENGSFAVEDLGSTNGTFVNRGRRLLPGVKHLLNNGDEIIVGKTFLRFHIID